MVEGNLARSRDVVVGRIRDGVQEIVEGLKAGESVVLSGQSRLSDGTAVAIQAPIAASGDPKPAMATEASAKGLAR